MSARGIAEGKSLPEGNEGCNNSWEKAPARDGELLEKARAGDY